MRLVGQIYVTLQGSVVRRDPTLWEKLRRRFGAELDLDTGKVRVELEATAVVEQVRQALVRLGVGNALSLVIDDTVVFQDTEGKADDLPDLVLALAEHASLFGRGFSELRFAAEHEEAGLSLLIEARARTEHARDEPATVISVGGRLRDLEPRPGESAEDYRRRVEPLTGDRGLLETARLQFESFVARLESALRAIMPEAKVEQRRADASIVRVASPRDEAEAQRTPQSPTHPGYDPFPLYYAPSPLGMMLDMMLLSSFMHMLSPPHILVMNPAGMTLGTAQEAAANPEILTAGAPEDDGGDADSEDDGAGPGDDGGDGDLDSGFDGDFGMDE